MFQITVITIIASMAGEIQILIPCNNGLRPPSSNPATSTATTKTRITVIFETAVLRMARKYSSGAVTVRCRVTAVDRRALFNANKGLKTIITQMIITGKADPVPATNWDGMKLSYAFKGAHSLRKLSTGFARTARTTRKPVTDSVIRISINSGAPNIHPFNEV